LCIESEGRWINLRAGGEGQIDNKREQEKGGMRRKSIGENPCSFC
jgi:hypothetical protein